VLWEAAVIDPGPGVLFLQLKVSDMVGRNSVMLPLHQSITYLHASKARSPTG
jgi:hypothetical protein